MYISKKQMSIIQEACENIKVIASMETCNLSLSEDDKKKVKDWCQWFSCYADIINKQLEDIKK